MGIRVEWLPLAPDTERTIMVSWPGKWALMFILPRIGFYRKRRHPSQKALVR